MAQLVNIKKKVRLDNTFPSGGSTTTVDEIGRINSITADYDSVKVVYTITYILQSGTIETYTRTITDQTV